MEAAAPREVRACAADELAEGRLHPVEVQGRRIMLTMADGRCHAVGATCPHAGAPLAEGVLGEDGVVVCPWHKAAFRVTTGERIEPPALDDLPIFPARIVDDAVMVTLGNEADRVDPLPPASPDAAPGPSPRPQPGRDGRCFLIVGAGAAGAAAAQELRGQGFTGRVVMVGREDRLPYDRTVLSKYALSGKKGGEKSPLQDAAFYSRHGIERRTGTVVRMDVAARTARFADGTTIAYDAALVATGGEPRPLQVPGAGLGNVFLLRTHDDAQRIVAGAAADDVRQVVVIGGGFIAAEAAASLRERGLEVTMVVPEGAPLQRQLGAEVGDVFRRFHAGKGIQFRLKQKLAALEGDGRVREAVLEDGSRLRADLVVAGLGVSPATAMLDGVELRKDGGVAVDAGLRVGAAAGLFAAGDIAAFPLRGGGPQIRVEHWRVAQQHGRVAALNMLGRDVCFDAVPYFWTIHFTKRLDYVGHAEKWDEVVLDGDLETPRFMAFYVRDGRVAALAGWDRDRPMAAAIRLMEQRRDGWTPAELRDALRRWAD